MYGVIAYDRRILFLPNRDVIVTERERTQNVVETLWATPIDNVLNGLRRST